MHEQLIALFTVRDVFTKTSLQYFADGYFLCLHERFQHDCDSDKQIRVGISLFG